MSKKEKNKFKKRLRAEILKEISKGGISRQPEVVTVEAKPEITPLESPQRVQAPQREIESEKEDSIQFSQDSTVKHDLKKSAIIIGTIFIVIIGLYIVDLKTNVLLNSGNYIFTKLNIGH